MSITYRRQTCNLFAFAIKSSHRGLVFWNWNKEAISYSAKVSLKWLKIKLKLKYVSMSLILYVRR